MNHEHFVAKCDHGIVVSQCRCADPSKSVRIVECPANCPERQKKWAAELARDGRNPTDCIECGSGDGSHAIWCRLTPLPSKVDVSESERKEMLDALVKDGYVWAHELSTKEADDLVAMIANAKARMATPRDRRGEERSPVSEGAVRWVVALDHLYDSEEDAEVHAQTMNANGRAAFVLELPATGETDV